MSKGQDSKKTAKKEPAKTQKEKKTDKRLKKEESKGGKPINLSAAARP